MELYEQIRREYEHGAGTIRAVARGVPTCARFGVKAEGGKGRREKAKDKESRGKRRKGKEERGDENAGNGKWERKKR